MLQFYDVINPTNYSMYLSLPISIGLSGALYIQQLLCTGNSYKGTFTSDKSEAPPNDNQLLVIKQTGDTRKA